MTRNQNKTALRTQMKTQRANWTDSPQAAESIQQNVVNYLKNKDFLSIFCYLSTADEAPTWMLVEHLLNTTGTTVTCPRIVNRSTMVPVRLQNLNQLDKGPLGIYTSAETAPYDKTIDVAIVPGLAFTLAGDRLGYGGGYYDRWFEQQPACQRIAICYENQILESVPTEAHDIPMHTIVTETRAYECSHS